MPALLVDYFCAGVVELADASDSKSEGARPRAGSIPASGTSIFMKFQINFYDQVARPTIICQ